MANSGITLPALLALVGLAAFAGCEFPLITPAAADPLTSQLMTQPGRVVVAQGVRVQHVAADEGFWVNLDGDRVWVQLTTRRESPFVVRDGDVVSFRGTVVAHDRTFPDGLGMCSPADARAVAAEATHVAVPVRSLSFGVG